MPRPRPAPPRARPARPTAAALAALDGDALSLLDCLGEARFLTRTQAAAVALGGDATRALSALRRAGLAARLPYRPAVRAPLESVWSLTPPGARAAVARASAAAGEGGLADPALRRRARQLASDPLSPLFMAHALAVADLYVAVRRRSTAPLRWLAGEAARVRFRSFASAGGWGTLVPDAIVAPADLGYGEDPLGRGAAALEIDRATMGRAAIERKLLRYRERVADRGPFGPVLFVADGPERRQWLGRLLAGSGLEGAALDLDGAAAAAAEVAARLAGAAGE